MTMVAEEFQREVPAGFEGAVAGLTLPDVIQMNALNRFSGCISVHFGQHAGLIFFRDGEIIHAEQGEKTGEDAFYEILQWPGPCCPPWFLSFQACRCARPRCSSRWPTSPWPPKKFSWDLSTGR